MAARELCELQPVINGYTLTLAAFLLIGVAAAVLVEPRGGRVS
jgi:hypothetical protein